MRRALLTLLAALGFLLPAAHAHRWHGLPEALAWLVPALALFTGREFARRAAQLALLAGSLVLVDTMLHFIMLRSAMGAPWMRLALILSASALVPLAAAWALERPLSPTARAGRESPGDAAPEGPTGASPEEETASREGRSEVAPRAVAASPALAGRSPWPGLAAAALAFAGLAAVQLKAARPMLLAERFVPGAGWLEAALLALYAGFAAEALLRKDGGRARRLLWGVFSAAFFAQLALGLAGFDRFLMSGALHLPVPALIAAGPLYRGEGLFMLALFAGAVLLVGPGWCSHLCYIGAWDSACSQALKRPAEAPRRMRAARAVLAALALGGAWAMGRAGVPAWTAGALAAGFGLAGVGVMLFVSRRLGVMAHCAGWCPMGLAAGLLGRLSPWRLAVAEGCTGCGRCARACRYDALRPEDLARRAPGVSCSLCRDCLERCPHGVLSLTFLGRSRPWTEPAYAALAGALMAVFLGVARL
ncbi:hypothetical protein NNJEOMEG_01689 [Fundidesulfovibrio magnetotacticus]|uniref:4Fe-4S ferredoxin-type domain-containing protein n=1 Tax=Fundidesulfovibrio magnetotacticus TaxID=2730080 RepID=A0A6V8LMF3_9BACT|nr:4Fe-4S dicluster domain-containing protein [Fundidesulfovibrio magnetotacticus]GFK93853.1 hypothetical protein NNJEOMEG_01689 [Fundidesulfovibrio magnetotacticus]